MFAARDPADDTEVAVPDAGVDAGAADGGAAEPERMEVRA
jgi:hypothetical protein